MTGLHRDETFTEGVYRFLNVVGLFMPHGRRTHRASRSGRGLR